MCRVFYVEQLQSTFGQCLHDALPKAPVGHSICITDAMSMPMLCCVFSAALVLKVTQCEYCSKSNTMPYTQFLLVITPVLHTKILLLPILLLLLPILILLPIPSLSSPHSYPPSSFLPLTPHSLLLPILILLLPIPSSSPFSSFSSPFSSSSPFFSSSPFSSSPFFSSSLFPPRSHTLVFSAGGRRHIQFCLSSVHQLT